MIWLQIFGEVGFIKVIILFLIVANYSKLLPLPTLEVDKPEVSLLEQAEFAVTTNPKLSFEQAKRLSYSSIGTKFLNRGYTDESVWVRIRLVSKIKKRDWFLQLWNPQLDEVRIFWETDSGVWQRVTGDKKPFVAREVPVNFFTEPIPFETKGDLYVNVTTTSGMVFYMDLLSKSALYTKTKAEYTLFGVYTGILLIMLAYNFFLFVALRDRTYGYYVAYLIGVLFLQLWLNGLDAEYLWPHSTIWRNLNGIFFVFLCLVAGLRFARLLLDVDRIAPRLAKWIRQTENITLVAWAFYILYIAYRYWNPDSSGTRFTEMSGNLSTFVLSGLSLAAGIISLRTGYRPALYFLIAWGILLGSLIIFALAMQGFLPANLFTMYIPMLGSALEISLLAFALSEKIRVIRIEKDSAMRQLQESAQLIAKLRKEQVAITKDLDSSEAILKKILTPPEQVSSLPGLEIDIRYLPFNEKIGGDYYQLKASGKGRLQVFLADVIGHGIQAALNAVQIHIMLREAQKVEGLAEKMRFLNEYAVQSSNESLLFTAFLAEIQGNSLLFCSAGHPAQLLYKKSIGQLQRLKTQGRLIGVKGKFLVDESETKIEPGDILWVFSDGLIEMVNPAKEILDESRVAEKILSLLEQNTDAPLRQLSSGLLEWAESFRETKERQDDLTIIAIRMR